MKRNITVVIDIDTEHDGDSRLMVKSEDNYCILIRRDVEMFGDKPYVLPCTLSHELGHLVGHVFNLPATAAEPRSLFQDIDIAFTKSEQERILASENEAWDVGELMLSASRMREYALGTYISWFDNVNIHNPFGIPKDNSK